MATSADTISMDWSMTSAGSLTCALCLEVFRYPKILPCFHSFCEQCLKDLAAQHRLEGSFPCPICRKETVLPPGGVSEFQTNFHIDPDDLERARGGSRCSRHPKRELELCCVSCGDLPICARCIPDHQQHKTKDIAEAARPARSRLSQDILRLQRYEEKVQRNINEVQIRRQDLQDKCLAIETDIRSRHETIVAAADQYHAEALASLEAVTSDIEAGQLSDLDRLQSNLQALTELRDRIQQALDSGAASNLVSASWAMRSGRGSEKALAELMKNQVTTVQHPVLHFTSLSPPFFHSMRDFVGSVSRLEMKVLSVPEGTIVERFRYGQDNNLEVYSLCPLEDGSVWVAFEPHLHLGELSPCRLGRAGEVLGTSDRFVGRVTFAPVSQSLCLFLASTTEKDSTYAKRQGMSVQRYWMENSHIHAENPHTGQTMKFNINCRSHRAFDASGRKNLFVVLKEPKAPHQQRKVRLYGLHMFRAIAKYRPPETAFRPSDVCFYTLGGQEVLLVADELNNAIHVVDVQRKRGLAGYVSKWSYELNFSRYLAPGCPLLVQPTALNTDTSGRLWVACRGGRILTFKPAERNKNDDADFEFHYTLPKSPRAARLMCLN